MSKAEEWLEEIKRYDDEFDSYEKRCEKITSKYRDDRKGSSKTKTKHNLFWAHIQTLQPTIFSNVPGVSVERRYKDKDGSGRFASLVLERAVKTQLDLIDSEIVAKNSRDDFLLYGRGAARSRYVADFGPGIERIPVFPNINQDTGEQLNPPFLTEDQKPVDPMLVKQDNDSYYIEVPFDQLLDERVEIEFVHRGDFKHEIADRWDLVKWVAFENYLTKKEVEKKFGEEKAELLKYATTKQNKKRLKYDELSDNSTQTKKGKALIYEIWDAERKKVYWVSPELKEECLFEAEDPYNLKHFFPLPRPAYGTMTTDSLEPVPDYALIQDILEQYDEVTTRQSRLIKALKVAGIYDATCEEISRLTDENTDTKLVAVKNWRAMTEKGGLQNAINWMPIEQIAAVLKITYEIQNVLKQHYYEITGNSDIIRGATNAYETATAQSIKSRFASIRLQEKQNEFQRFWRDLIRIVAELVAENFSDETLLKASGAEQLPGYSPEIFSQAVALLRDNKLRDFRIDIETDQMQMLDEQAEKESANEFVGVVGSLMEKLIPMASQIPSFAPVASEVLMLSARKFKSGRSIESAIEQFMENLSIDIQKMQEAQQQGTPPSDIEMAKLDLEKQKLEAETFLESEKNKTDALLKDRELKLKEAEMFIKQLQIRNQELESQVSNGVGMPALTATSKSLPLVLDVKVPVAKRKRVKLVTDPTTGTKYGEVEDVPEEEVNAL